MSIMYHITWFLTDFGKLRTFIAELALRDFKTRYIGSFLGVVWVFVHPIVTILVMWFIFQMAFKAQEMQGFPFVVWLMTSMIMWNFFADALNGATNSIIENANLVKKVVVRVSILPVVKIISSFYIHLIFLGLLFLVALIYGVSFSWTLLQIPYYLLCAVVFVLGLSWVTSALAVFIRDISQIVTIVLQLGFWITPIFWPLERIPAQFRFLLKLNPVCYITEGYRSSFLTHTWFWNQIEWTCYFWFCAIGSIVIGAALFNKLRSHFADIL